MMLNGRIGDKGEKSMYEYVPKNEYQPVRNQLEVIIHNIQKYMREKFKTTFQYRLIGSGGRHLITRVVGGNGGFDFDYNFIVSDPGEGYHYNADVLKAQFMEATKNAIRSTAYSNPQDSTSAITIKVIDQANSRIVHSCDFAIIYYEGNVSQNGYYCLKNNKAQQQYVFEFRKLSKYADDKLDDIKKYSGGWAAVVDEYLKLKNANRDQNKHSFSLYLEAVSNVYEQLPEEDEDEDEDDYD